MPFLQSGFPDPPKLGPHLMHFHNTWNLAFQALHRIFSHMVMLTSLC